MKIETKLLRSFLSCGQELIKFRDGQYRCGCQLAESDRIKAPDINLGYGIRWFLWRKYDGKENIHPQFHPRFFGSIYFFDRFSNPHSSPSNLSFEAGVNRGRDWNSYRSLQRLFPSLETLRREISIENSRKKFYGRRVSPPCSNILRVSSIPPFLALLRCESPPRSWPGLLLYGFVHIYHEY